MNKHLFAIFTYFATFFLSFFLVSFLTETRSSKRQAVFQDEMPHQTFETEQQKQIRNLLTLDQKYGWQYFAGTETAEDTKIW